MRTIALLLALAGCQYRGDESVQTRPLFDGVTGAQAYSAYAVVVSWPRATDATTDQPAMRYSVWSANPMDMAHDFTTDVPPAVVQTGTLKALVGALTPATGYVFMAHATNVAGVRDKNVAQIDATTLAAPPSRTLAADVQPILAQSCAAVGRCHGPKDASGAGMDAGMDLSTAASSAAALVGVAATINPAAHRVRVQAHDSGNSFLMDKLLGILSPSDGAKQPPDNSLPAITDDQIRIISEWIDQGAMP